MARTTGRFCSNLKKKKSARGCWYSPCTQPVRCCLFVYLRNEVFRQNRVISTLAKYKNEPTLDAQSNEILCRFNREATMRKESGMGRMWVNPYKSLVPQVGYYDINCLIEALKLKKCHVSLHAVFNPKVCMLVCVQIRTFGGFYNNRFLTDRAGGKYHGGSSPVCCPSSSSFA